MLRGAIEVAQATRVAGWIFAETMAMRGKTVLAFVDGRCVGAGQVECFRQDLLDAKLGDGYCGFDFAVNLDESDSVGALIVRLQHSDVSLLQESSRVLSSDGDSTGAVDLGAIQPSSVSWMMDRGMLEQQEYDFLKAIHTIGAYERGLRVPRRVGSEAGHTRIEPSHTRIEPDVAAHDLISLLMMTETRVSRAGIGSLYDLALHSYGAVPVYAIWGQERGRISLDERSHLAGRSGEFVLPAPPPGGIDYSFGPDRLLFIHRDCRLAARGPAPASGIVLFTAAPIEVVSAEPVRRFALA